LELGGALAGPALKRPGKKRGHDFSRVPGWMLIISPEITARESAALERELRTDSLAEL
jgi:hypothetical protein